MEFGSWLARVRSERELTTRKLEEWTGVSNATISRLERGQRQITLPTAVLLCSGLEISLTSMYEELFDETPPTWLRPQPWSVYDDHLVDFPTLRAFVGLYLQSKDAAYLHLATALTMATRVLTKSSDSLALERGTFDKYDILRLMHPSPIYNLELQYPPMSAKEILTIYNRSDVVTFADAGAYLRERRIDIQQSQTQSERHLDLSASVLSRLESGLLENIKLMDVVSLDKAFGESGEVLGMYWEATRLQLSLTRQATEDDYFSDLIGPQIDQDLIRVVELFITVYRWLEHAPLHEEIDKFELLDSLQEHRNA